MTDVHSPSPQPAEDHEADAPPKVLQMGSRRLAPKYRVFIGAGVLLGFLVALVLTFTRPESEYGYGAVFGYTALMCGFVGALVGGLVAVALDRRGR